MKDYETTRMEEDRQTRDDYCQAEDRYCEPPDAYCDEPEEVLTSDYQEGLARGYVVGFKAATAKFEAKIKELEEQLKLVGGK